MSLSVICKFVSWVDGNKSDSDELRLQLLKYHQTTTSRNCHHLKKVYNFILEGVAINLVGYGETQEAKNKYRQSKVLAGLYKRKACLYIGQNSRGNQF